MEILDKIQDLKFIKINRITKDSIFVGKYLDNVAVVVVKTVPLNDTEMIADMLNNTENYSKIFDNNRFKKFICDMKNKYEITLLYPAQHDDLIKYVSSKKRIVLETPQMYREQMYPNIIKQDLSWIHNIFDGTAERDRVLYEDDDFILLPDMKWTKRSAKNRDNDSLKQNEVRRQSAQTQSAQTQSAQTQSAKNCDNYDNMYCLAIVKDGSLKSIRDLRKKDIPMLNNIYENSIKTIENIYGTRKDQIRSYFHYRPSFWHLHIHFNLITDLPEGANIDISHRLQTVITNLELRSTYYEEATLEVIELEY
jgi:m7GpppX diphosphatase